MLHYCWTCHTETLHQRKNLDFLMCMVCKSSNWDRDYPIGENEIPQNPLVAARLAYQDEKRRYYGERGESYPAHVIYSHLPGQHAQDVYGIQQDTTNDRWVAHTFDKRTYSNTQVFAKTRQGPYYVLLAWLDMLEKEGGIAQDG
jgi:hypothetical protein